MRGNWLSNRIFQTCDDILAHCCEAWNKLTDQPWRIMSIGLREWAHGCGSMSIGISLHLASRGCTRVHTKSASGQSATFSTHLR